MPDALDLIIEQARQKHGVAQPAPSAAPAAAAAPAVPPSAGIGTVLAPKESEHWVRTMSPDGKPVEHKDVSPFGQPSPDYPVAAGGRSATQPYEDSLSDARQLAAQLIEITKKPKFADQAWSDRMHEVSTYKRPSYGQALSALGLGDMSKSVGGPAGEVDPDWSTYLSVVGEMKGKLARIYMGGRPSDSFREFVSNHFPSETYPPRDNSRRIQALMAGILHGGSDAKLSEDESKTFDALQKQGYKADEANAVIRINRVMLDNGAAMPGEKF